MRTLTKSLLTALAAFTAPALAGCALTTALLPDPARAQSTADWLAEADAQAGGLIGADAVGVVTRITIPPGSAEGYVGALADVTLAHCLAAQAPAVFVGTVTNPAETEQSYRIYVSVVTGDRTIGLGQVDVERVGPGVERAWYGSLEVGAADAQCALRVERTPAST